MRRYNAPALGTSLYQYLAGSTRLDPPIEWRVTEHYYGRDPSGEVTSFTAVTHTEKPQRSARFHDGIRAPGIYGSLGGDRITLKREREKGT